VWPAGAFAQTVRATIQGRVVDPSGGVVAGAEVVVTSDATGYRASVRADDRGWFIVAAVEPGGYRIEVAHDGFRRHSQTITLAVNERRRLDVTLQPGPVSEIVVVTAPVAPIDRAPGSLGSRVDPDRVANLPLDGRNFLELALLSPGAVPAAQGSAGSVRGDFTLNVNGAREDANAYLLDGAYNVDPKLNAVAVRPPVDAVREFEVLTSTPDASFGRSAGGQINVVTRAGTNRLAATAYDFMRTGAFNARNYFAPKNEPAPSYRRHQFGGSLGGPIRESRLFYFADYEGTRLTEGVTRVTSVPTLAERRGDFSASLLPPPVNPFTGQPFPGGQIPGQLLNPIGLSIAGLYPRPNRGDPVANHVSSPDQVDAIDQFDVRLDYQGEGYSVTGRYSFSDRRLFEPFAGPQFAAVPGFGTDVARRAENLILSSRSPIRSRFTNEARLAWTRVSTGVFHQGQGSSLNRDVGLPELSANPRDWGLSFITVAGFSPLGDEYNNPQESRTNMWQIADTVSWTAGSHLLRAGGEVRLLGQTGYRDVQARGLLQFTNQAFTRNALADLLLGLPTVTVGAEVDNPQNLRTESYAFFLQDSVQLSPTVTVSAGLRYEFNSAPVDAADRVTVYDPAAGTIVPVGEGRVPRSGTESDRNNFTPRLGLAWSVRPETVVRAGYGVSYDQGALAPNEFLYFNPPYYLLNTYFTIPGLYTLTLYDPFPASFPFALPKTATAVQPNLRTSYLHQWHVGGQHQLDDRRTVSAGYVGSRGRNLVSARDLNQPAPSASPVNLRPNPAFADILIIESRARSSYDALELRFDQRPDRGVSFTAAYTLGRSMDEASGFFPSAGDANFPQDSRHPEAEWARSSFDVRHRFTLGGLWQLPFGPDRRWLKGGFAATCLGSWDLYAVVLLQSGRPFTVAVHPDIDVSNTGRANLGFGYNDRPNLVGSPDLAERTPERWFRTEAFAMPPFGSFGDVGRNTLEGPGSKNVNLALARKVALSRGVFQLRLEVFNALNWTNFGLPDNFLGSQTFGQILSAGAPRRLQLGLRYLY
jgi:outer membrane receptor protein involved in Fe transport